MKLILKNCSLVMQYPKITEIESVHNSKNIGVNYPGNYQNMGLCQSWIYPLVKGATYELAYVGSITMDIGSVWLCSLCNLGGDYTTVPQNEVGEMVFNWDKGNAVQGGRFTVPEDTDKDCIVVTGLNDTYDQNIEVILKKLG